MVRKLPVLAFCVFAGQSPAVLAAGDEHSVSTGFQPLFRSTHLIEFQQGSALSDKVNLLQAGGFESARGEWVSFGRWYRSQWADVRVTWMSQVSQNWGVIWGGSTGERGEKYAIAPSAKFGLVFQTALDKASHLSFKATTIVGGRLRERSCVADYGPVGGIQEVNCRLAASVLEPSETLRYALNERPDRHLLLVQYRKTF